MAVTASARLHTSSSLSFMELFPFCLTAALTSMTGRKNEQARETLRPLLIFVKKVRETFDLVLLEPRGSESRLSSTLSEMPLRHVSTSVTRAWLCSARSYASRRTHPQADPVFHGCLSGASVKSGRHLFRGQDFLDRLKFGRNWATSPTRNNIWNLTGTSTEAIKPSRYTRVEKRMRAGRGADFMAYDSRRRVRTHR